MTMMMMMMMTMMMMNKSSKTDTNFLCKFVKVVLAITNAIVAKRIYRINLNFLDLLRKITM